MNNLSEKRSQASLRRRTLIAAAGSSFGAGIAGCLDGDSGTATRLVELRGVNYTSESRILNVEIRTDGETRYTESVELEGAPEGEGGFVGSVFDGYPTAPGPHVIHGWHDEQPREQSATFDFTKIDHECVTVQVQIGAGNPDLDAGSDILFGNSVGCPDEE